MPKAHEIIISPLAASELLAYTDYLIAHFPEKVQRKFELKLAEIYSRISKG